MSAITLFTSIGICLLVYVALRRPAFDDASSALRAAYRRDELAYFGILACSATIQALAAGVPDFLGANASPFAHWAVSLALVVIVMMMTYVRLTDMVRQRRAAHA